MPGLVMDDRSVILGPRTCHLFGWRVLASAFSRARVNEERWPGYERPGQTCRLVLAEQPAKAAEIGLTRDNRVNL